MARTLVIVFYLSTVCSAEYRADALDDDDISFIQGHYGETELIRSMASRMRAFEEHSAALANKYAALESKLTMLLDAISITPGQVHFTKDVVINAHLGVTGAATVGNGLTVDGDTQLNAPLAVFATAKLAGVVSISNKLFVGAGNTVSISSPVTFATPVRFSGGDVSITDANLMVASSLVGKGNVLVGTGHRVSGRNSLVAGLNHSCSADHAAVLGGEQGDAIGQGSVVVGGISNFASGSSSVCMGGANNSAQKSLEVVVSATFD